MKKLLLLTITAILYSFASFAQMDPLSPNTGGLCIGATMWVSEPDSSTYAGGAWSSSNVAVATVGSSGISTYAQITGVSAGVVTITYTDGSSYVTGTYTVGPAPDTITGGGGTYCPGGSVTLGDATTGGVWSSSDASIATVNAATGLVTATGGGTDIISYTVEGCSTTTNISVPEAPSVAPVDGLDGVCIGASITLEDSAYSWGTGSSDTGVWSSSNISIATIGSSTGIVTGISGSTTTITYSVSYACGSNYSTMVVTVGDASPGTIYGTTTFVIGSTSTLNLTGGIGAYTGGTWSSSNAAIASVDPSTGIVTGIALGSAVITYSISTCSTVVTTTTTVTVTALNGISGNVIFTSPYNGDVKVWLITYDPGTYMLEAQDSVTVYCSGTSVYYQFTSLTTDSFRVKAAALDTISITSSYIPTYHDTSFYWDSASVIAYTTGASDINENINMLWGATITGPGFIAGNVLTGANRGTSAGIPVVGMNMYALNTTTNTIAGMTTTGTTGSYSFSDLPYGTYTIFPDSLNYATTAFTNITLSASAATFSDAGFAQNLIAKTIVPVNTSVHNVTPTVSSVSTFPNPTSGKLNIQWTEITAEKGTISITDITGRAVYTSTISMAQGSGLTAIDLSGFTNGVYMINIKSTSLDYNSKIEVMK